MKFPPVYFMLSVLVLSPGALAAEPSPPGIAGHEERAAALHEREPETFRQDPAAAERIDFDAIDYDLLAAAVFHETNRQRARHELPPLKYLPELREAARIQARSMLKEGQISHVHPNEGKETLADRIGHVGLNGRYFSENVAMVFGRQYQSGEPFFSREENGEMIVSETHGGPPIPAHTYLSFARSLVGSWMDSPDHRKNILANHPRALGAECLHTQGPEGMDRFYCAQVFFAPFETPVKLEN